MSLPQYFNYTIISFAYIVVSYLLRNIIYFCWKYLWWLITRTICLVVKIRWGKIRIILVITEIIFEWFKSRGLRNSHSIIYTSNTKICRLIPLSHLHCQLFFLSMWSIFIFFGSKRLYETNLTYDLYWEILK